MNKASPEHRDDVSASSIVAGTTAHDSSTITGLVNSTGTGTVTYSYYTNNTCTANAVTVGIGDGADKRHGAQLAGGHARQRRDLLLAGGLQRRLQQQRRLEPLHVRERRAADGDQGVADNRNDVVVGSILAGTRPMTPRR